MTNVQPDDVEEIVILRGGLLVLTEALRFALDLERRQIEMRVDNDGVLLVGPRRLLSAGDEEMIRRFRDDLIALCEYEAPRA